MSTKTLRLASVAVLSAALLLADVAVALRPEGAPVILRRDVHFQTQEGESLVLEPGNYYVSVGQEPPLIVTREYEEDGVRLAALMGQHGEKLDEAWAESISKGEDEHHLILLLPDGRSIDATGSYSGVATRAASTLDAASVRSYREEWSQWPPPGVRTRAELAPVPPPPAATPVTYTEGFERDLVIVKFHEGAAIRLPELATRSGEPVLEVDSGLAGRMERQQRMQQRNLTPEQVAADVQQVNQILGSESVEDWIPLVDRPERFMEAERYAAEQESGQQQGDLGNVFAIKLREGAAGEGVANQLIALRSVETAYLQPIPQDADIAPPTPDWQGNQGYLEAAPQGIDAKYAWTIPGGKGRGVRIIDVENGWQLDHEDLPARLRSLEDRDGQRQGSGQHGVAVMGEIIAKADGHGVTGIAHEGQFNVAPVNRKRSQRRRGRTRRWTEYNVAEAITAAAGKLRRGDVILIEQHYPSGKNSGTCPAACGNCSQWGYVAMEYFEPEYLAIAMATARGIHVVEAAGNGGMNLDDARYGGRFDRNYRDSGAIVVGASDAALRPECWSNHGSRVDVHGWGRNIWTLGYGNQKVTGAPPADKRQWYSRSFGGTSGASPIVVGAVMSIVGAQKAASQRLLGPRAMRRLLTNTGTPQQAYQPPAGMAAENRRIGPMPDLRRAFGIQLGGSSSAGAPPATPATPAMGGAATGGMSGGGS